MWIILLDLMTPGKYDVIGRSGKGGGGEGRVTHVGEVVGIERVAADNSGRVWIGIMREYVLRSMSLS